MTRSLYADDGEAPPVTFCVRNVLGAPVAGVSVTVNTGGAKAAIFADPGLTAAQANPLTSDGHGNCLYYAPPGTYSHVLSGAVLPVEDVTVIGGGGLSAAEEMFIQGDFYDWVGQQVGGNNSYADLTHDNIIGYLLHLHSGAKMRAPAALVGLGVGDGGATDGTGLLISQKAASSGDAVQLVNQAGTTGHGLHGQASAAAAPLVYLEQVAAGAADVLRQVANNVPTSGQLLSLWQVGNLGGTIGQVLADTGELVWAAPVRVQGSRLAATEQSGVATPARAELAAAQAYHPMFLDGATTAASATLTSATAAFAAGDVGLAVTGPGIPAGTTIAAVTNATTATLSQAATATAAGIAFTVYRAGTANLPSLRLYRFSGAAGTYFPWRIGMDSPTGLTFATTNQAFAAGAETYSVTALKLDRTGGNPEIGFLGAAPAPRQAVAGSRGGNAALASLLTALATLGLITDGSTA